MKPLLLMSATALFLAACSQQDGDEESAQTTADTQSASKPVVVLETSLGNIRMELEHELARETVANFLLHVRNDFYDSLTFHRVRPGFMIQAGRILPDRRERLTPAPPIANEAENGLLNVRGAVAMARTSDPHSATTEFFINLVDNPTLDFRDMTARGFGYAVFGHVIDGMDVVDAIAQVRTERTGLFEAIPLEPVVIYRATIEGG
jgi:cyclophilin family peptidyl-prolyl cis-trans isomerase